MEKIPEIYNPNEQERETIRWVYDNFKVMWENSQKTYEQFGGLTPLGYFDKGRKGINVMNKPRADGRSNAKSMSPLNKLKAILARVATKRPDIEVDATNKANDIDLLRGQVLKDLHTHSHENIDTENTANVNYFFKALNTLGDGTSISYEGHDSQTHTQEKIIDYDPDTGEVTSEEEEFTTNECYNQRIQPEDFFIWNPYVASIQKQPRVAWRTVYSKAKFDEEFGGYKNAKYVLTKSARTEYKREDSYFKDEENSRITDDQVEVIRMFDKTGRKKGNKRVDRMVILANSVVLQDTPMIFNNGKPKKYPFARTIADAFVGPEFFWGRHLWHILEGDVSLLELLFNLGAEQHKLAVNPPHVIKSGNETEDGLLLPGRTIEVDDVDQFKEVKFSPPSQSYTNFLEKIGQNIDLASLDPVSSGQNIPDATARGQVIAEENARKLLSLFNMMMENMVLQEAKLRIYNIIQFQLKPGAFFRVDGTMVDNESGVREINVVSDMNEAEPQEKTDLLEYIAEVSGINLERLNITPRWFDGIKWSIKVLSESAYQQGKSLAIALEEKKMATVAQLFPNIFQASSEVFFKQLMKVYDDDPQKYLEAVQQGVVANDLLLNQQKQGGGNKLINQIAGDKQDLGLAELTNVGG